MTPKDLLQEIPWAVELGCAGQLDDSPSLLTDLIAMKDPWYHRVIAAILIALAILVALHVSGLVNVPVFIKDYQGLVGSLVGIVGTGTFGFWSVNETLRRNALNIQQQKDREIDQERIAVRAMLLAELQVMHLDLESRLKAMKDLQTKNNYLVPDTMSGESFTRVYRALISRVGLLADDEVTAVVKAYAEFDGYLEAQSFLKNLQLTMNKREPGITNATNIPYEGYVTRVGYMKRYVQTAVEALGGEV